MAGRPRSPRPPGLLGDIGARVESLRKIRGWTVHQLADASGVSSANLIKIEGGRADPTITRIKAIAEALGTTGRTLLGTW